MDQAKEQPEKEAPASQLLQRLRLALRERVDAPQASVLHRCGRLLKQVKEHRAFAVEGHRSFQQGKAWRVSNVYPR